MGKIAFIFPGQGAQYVGMGKDFYDAIPECREVYELASKESGLNVEELCFQENDKINITEYTQIAMLATELAILEAVKLEGIKPDVAAGLSLGEYGAIAVSECMDKADLFRLIRKRGIYMQEAVPEGGAMAAVLSLDTAVIEKICDEISAEMAPKFVSIANYNCPGQIVITGHEETVAVAMERLTQAGAKRCILLKVSGPFHSKLLVGAGEKLGQALEEVELKEMKVPYLSNVTADYVQDTAQIKELLISQVASSVKWQQSVEKMIEDGVDTFFEIGPGKTLAGFMKRINKEVKVYNIEKMEDLEKWRTVC